MNWNLEGHRIEATYLEEIPVCGRVEQSRVKFGGNVCHTVVLDMPITVYGAVRERVIVDHGTVERVMS
mgnify:CR=1 FL=1